MKRQFIRIFILVAALVEAAVAGDSTNEAPTPAMQAITVDALVEEALQQNPELIFVQTEVDAAAASLETAGVPANPELSGTLGRKTVDSAGLRDEGVAWSVSVAQSFEWPGRIGLRKAIANRDVELAELGVDRFRSALASRVRLLACVLSAAQQKAAAAQEVADRLSLLREVLVQRDPAGITPLLETRVVEATEVNAQRAAGEAAQEAQTALFELNALRGKSPDAALAITEMPLKFDPIGNKDALLAAARTDNFDVRVKAIELAQQGIRVDLVDNERFPAIAIEPSYSEEDAGEEEQVISLGISAPLPLWNRNAGSIKAAHARQLQAESSLDLARRNVERQVIQAMFTYESKVREMARWRPDSLQQFREAAELADRHYRLGAVPVATFIELQQQYLEAVESLLATKSEALEAALQLEQLTGLPAQVITISPKGEKQ